MAKKLLVRANPYLALDGEGRPSGRCPAYRMAGEYIGAKIDRDACKVVRAIDPKMRERGLQEDRGRFAFKFDSENIELTADGPEGNYYRERLTHGDLIPANEATAAACGRKFRDPNEVIAESRAAAIKAYRAETGEDPLCAATAHAHAPDARKATPTVAEAAAARAAVHTSAPFTKTASGSDESGSL